MASLWGIEDEDKQSAAIQGLLGGGLGILAANTNKSNPWQAIATGGLMGMQQYGSTLKTAREERELERKLKEAAEKQAIIKQYGASITDPTEQQRFMLDPMAYIKDAQNLEGFAPGSDIYQGGKKVGSVPSRANADDTPSSVQEYAYAKADGYKGTFEQWMKDKGAWGRSPAQPFYQALPTASGYQRFDARSGSMVPITGADSLPVIPAQYDPKLKGSISEAEATGSAKGKLTGTEQGNLPVKQEALRTTQDAIKILDDGIYTGFYGPTARTVMAATPMVSKKKVENTDRFKSVIGETVVPRLVEFGGNDSNEELAQLRAISGGDLTMQEGAIRKILTSAEAKIKRGIERVNKGLDPNGNPRGESNKTVVRTGTDKTTGRKVVKYSDGSSAYVD